MCKISTHHLFLVLTVLNVNILSFQIIPNGLIKKNENSQPFQVNQNTGPRNADQSNPKVIFSSRFGYSFAWSDYRIGDHEALYFQPTIGSRNILIIDDLAYSNSESASFDFSTYGNDFIFAWVSSKTRNLYIQKFSGNGGCIGIPCKVTDSLNREEFCPWSSFSPIIKRTKQNNLYILWEEACQGIRKNIYVQKFSKDLVKIGNVIKINDTSDFAFSNGYVSISVDENENFAVTWYSNFFENDTVKNTIFAQLFNSNCLPITSKIQIDTAEDNLIFYSKPSIAFLSNNNFIVVCGASYNDNGNTFSKMFAQLFNSTGNKIGETFLINDDENNLTSKFNPIVEFSPDSKIIIGWVENRTVNFDFDIVLQIYDLVGNPIGNNIIANDSRVGRQENLSIAVNQIEEFNEFLITWDDMRNGYDKDIYAQIFTTSGNYKDQNFIINDDEGSSNQYKPSICFIDNDNFVISWWDQRNFGGIYSQMFSPIGTPLGWNFSITDKNNSAPICTPSFCYTNNNELIFSWLPDKEYYSNVGYQKFSTNGNSTGSIKTLTNTPMRNNSNPSIDCDSLGNFYITWSAQSSIDTARNIDIYLHKYIYNSLYSNYVKVNDGVGSKYKKSPIIDVSPNGNYSIVWKDIDDQTEQSNIYLQLFSNNNFGEKMGGNIKVIDNSENQYIEHIHHNLATDTEGNSIVVWSDNRNEKYNIFAQHFTKEGEPVGQNFKVSNNLENEYSPSVSIDEEGKFIIVWVTWLNNSWTILGQRYLSNGEIFNDNFIISQTSVISNSFNLVSPNVKLHNNKIYTSWSDTRAGNSGFDIWANIIEWNDLVKIHEDEKINLIEDFQLYQNFPNPFNPITTIKYSIPSFSVILSETKNLKDFSSQVYPTERAPQNDNVNVSLKVYNILGRKIATLVYQMQKPGNYEIEFDGNNLSSGIYYYQLKADNFIKTRKMLLLK